MAKKKFSKSIIVLVILMNVVFTAAVLYVFTLVGSEPVTLIAGFFAFTTGEIFALASLEKFNKKTQDALVQEVLKILADKNINTSEDVIGVD